MILSIVIVNYNVKYFLEQCLFSLRKGCEGLKAEVIVVDNQSSDGSVDYLMSRFPEVKFLLNDNNEGFSKACNKGASIAKGGHILFLNPDTIVAEDSLPTCLQFLETHAEAGAIGVKMVDGTGRFLKESKRAFPLPLTSLFKLFGFSRLFPHSKTFSRYYLGHLDQNKNHEVEVLAGAFMMVKREALEKVGLFDEDFFMYGEDIDLSYRIKSAGYRNYYSADTSIIHFKGESTKRGTLNYVRMFYNAMSIFVRKHYGGSRAWVFTASLHVAIWLRALVSAGAKFVRWVGVPVIDALTILFSFWATKEIWQQFIKPEILYPGNLLIVALPAFTLIFLVAAYYAGLYNKRFRKVDLTRSMFVATAVLLSVYALFPEEYRFSRGVVLFGSVLSFLLIGLLRKIMISGGLLQKPFESVLHPYVLIAAKAGEYETVRTFLQKQKVDDKVIGRIAVNEDLQSSVVASLKELKDVSLALGAEEVVFVASEELSYKNIINFVSQTKPQLRLRFHAAGSCSIVGSDSNAASGEVVASETAFNLAKPNRRRVKRLIDVIASLLFVISFPIHFFGVKKPLSFFKNCFQILLAKKTWVGYTNSNNSLPSLRTPVVTAIKTKKRQLSEASKEIDYWYAKNYEPVHDIRLIVKNYIHLGG